MSNGLEGDLGSFGFISFEDLDNDNVKDAIYGNFNAGYFAWWKGVPNCTDDAATINETACGSYTVPSGDETYTTSGMYMDTIPTTLGCDSVLTINLTISPNGTSTDVQAACDSYTWIDGNTYTTSNSTATFVITGGAANGCDSVITLDLTINNSTTGTDVQEHCLTYTWIDGNTYTASNNTATHVLTNAAGCDSVVTLDLTINPLDDASFGIGFGHCQNGSDPTPNVTGLPGGTFSSTAGLIINPTTGEIDVSASTPGMYSITYTTNGTCPNSSSTTVNIIATDDAFLSYSSATYCPSDTDPSPVVNTSPGSFSGTAGLIIDATTGVIDLSASTAGLHTVTYLTGGSCSNTGTFDLTINPVSTGVDTQVHCISYTWIDGNTYTSSNNTATHILTNSVGCDSIVTLDLTINPLDDASFSYTTTTFCANDADPVATLSGILGGTFTATAGCVIFPSGTIDLDASTPGVHTVTYTTTGPCVNSSDVTPMFGLMEIPMMLLITLQHSP